MTAVGPSSRRRHLSLVMRTPGRISRVLMFGHPMRCRDKTGVSAWAAGHTPFSLFSCRIRRESRGRRWAGRRWDTSKTGTAMGFPSRSICISLNHRTGHPSLKTDVPTNASCINSPLLLDGWEPGTGTYRYQFSSISPLGTPSYNSARYLPVTLAGSAATCSGVPRETMRPPSSPPPGPMSIT